MASLQIPTLTAAQVPTARGVDLVAFYNRMTGKSILKFQDRATAERRCLELIEKQVEGKPVKQAKADRKLDVKPDAKPTPDVEKTYPQRVAAENPLRQKLGRTEKKPMPVQPKRQLNNVRAVLADRMVRSPMELMTQTLTTPKPEPKPRSADGHKRGPKPKWPLDARIELVAKENPKRKGTIAYEEFEFYKQIKTVREYLNFGGQLAYMNYDQKRGYIKIVTDDKK
jgi:hypothetical protein